MAVLCSKVPKSMLVSCRNKWRKMWDLIPMTLSIYNAILIPFIMSYSLPLEVMKTA